MNIYKFDKLSVGFYSIHSFIMEKFNRQSCPSFESLNHFFVQAEDYPFKDFVSIEKQTPCDSQMNIILETNVAFDNRHTSKAGEKLKIYPKEALERFCEMSGLEAQNRAFAKFLGKYSQVKRQFNIHNSFRISGEFKINDLEKFNKAIINGVGSRKSYGYGLIQYKTKW